MGLLICAPIALSLARPLVLLRNFFAARICYPHVLSFFPLVPFSSGHLFAIDHSFLKPSLCSVVHSTIHFNYCAFVFPALLYSLSSLRSSILLLFSILLFCTPLLSSLRFCHSPTLLALLPAPHSTPSFSALLSTFHHFFLRHVFSFVFAPNLLQVILTVVDLKVLQ